MGLRSKTSGPNLGESLAVGESRQVIECDVVVVGAGSAGAVIAGRLSASGASVVLLEAGPDYVAAQTPGPLASVGPFELLEEETKQIYMYPELRAVLSSSQGPIHYRRGRGVGGSSAVNGLFAIRPTVADLDEWAASGCEGWSFDEVLPFLNAMEDDADFGAEEYHGTGGPIPIRRPGPSEQTPLDEAFHAACLAAGHLTAPDHNAPGATGLSPYAYNGRDGRRVSTNEAYLEPARSRTGLRIIGGAMADHVLWEAGRPTGIAAVSDAGPLEVRATQIVLSAGAIHSPALLMRSGIGPAADLAALGIEVRADLPVGLGLQEHPAVAVLFQLDTGVPIIGRRHAAWCLRFDTADGDEPDGAMISATGTGDPDIGVAIGWVNRVESTGSVRLQSRDPRIDPVVEFRMLSAEVDVRRMRRLVEELGRLTESAAFAGLGQNLGLLISEADASFMAVEDVLAETDLAGLLRTAVFDASHPTSSCRMGSPDDPGAVVGPTALVHGFDNLRVADASVLPFVPRANTHLSAVLVGEKIAADLARALGRKSTIA